MNYKVGRANEKVSNNHQTILQIYQKTTIRFSSSRLQAKSTHGAPKSRTGVCGPTFNNVLSLPPLSPPLESGTFKKVSPGRANLGSILFTELANSAVDRFSTGTGRGENICFVKRRPLYFINVGPRPIFGHPMITYGLYCFPLVLVMFSVDFNRYGFVWFSYSFLTQPLKQNGKIKNGNKLYFLFLSH